MAKMMAYRSPMSFKAAIFLIILLGSLFHEAKSFVAPPRSPTVSFAAAPRRSRLFSTTEEDEESAPASPYPSVEQLSKDPFMKQVNYGAQMVPMLYEMKGGAVGDEPSYVEQALQNRLTAQLSHPDGIRGFFVSYLTVEGESPADWEQVPTYLVRAMAEADGSDLVPLACMNVVMPTAMITMHEDPQLKAQSALTGSRGARVLEALGSQSGENGAMVYDNCRAIYAVATNDDSGTDQESFKYWTDFFEKWGYKDPQKKDIASTMRALLDKLE